jgi:Ca2+:H+ antiporter
MPHNHHSHHAGESSTLLPSIHPDGESHRSGVSPKHFLLVLWKSSNAVSQYVNLLFPFSFLAIILNFLPGVVSPLVVFVVAYIGMIPAANLLGHAGQEFARKMPKVSGILIETTFGSVVEIVLFLILIVKHDGSREEGNLIPIIQAAVLGSILTNLLLCLGLCFVVGGLRQQIQTFHSAVSEVSTIFLAVRAQLRGVP